MSRRAPESRRGAFTLLEILVAVAILGIVATTVAFVMGVGVEAWRAGAEMAEESHDGEGVMEQVVMALRSAYYPANGAPDWDFGFQLEDGGTVLVRGCRDKGDVCRTDGLRQARELGLRIG